MTSMDHDKIAAVWRSRDRVSRYLGCNGTMRLILIHGTATVASAWKRHQLNPLTGTILGEALMGGMLCAAATTKEEERLLLRWEGNGPIGSVVAEAGSRGEVRGYVARPDTATEGKTREEMLAAALGIGLLHVVRKSDNQVEPRTSTVVSQYSRIAPDLAEYFATSEQTPTAVRLDVKLDDHLNLLCATGALLQPMPGHDLPEDSLLQQLETNLSQYLAPVQPPESLDPLAETIFEGEWHEAGTTPVDYFCSCSHEVFEKHMITLGASELRELAATGAQSIVCHYCQDKYEFSPQQLSQLAQAAEAN